MHEPNNVTHSFFAVIFLLIHKRKMIISTMPAIRRKVMEPRTLPMTTAEFIVCSELGAVISGTVGSEAKNSYAQQVLIIISKFIHLQTLLSLMEYSPYTLNIIVKLHIIPRTVMLAVLGFSVTLSIIISSLKYRDISKNSSGSEKLPSLLILIEMVSLGCSVLNIRGGTVTMV